MPHPQPPLYRVLLNMLEESLDSPPLTEAVVICVGALRRGRVPPEAYTEVLERLRDLGTDPEEYSNIHRLISHFESLQQLHERAQRRIAEAIQELDHD